MPLHMIGMQSTTTVSANFRHRGERVVSKPVGAQTGLGIKRVKIHGLCRRLAAGMATRAIGGEHSAATADCALAEFLLKISSQIIFAIGGLR